MVSGFGFLELVVELGILHSVCTLYVITQSNNVFQQYAKFAAFGF